jgi:hypothetical protein
VAIAALYPVARPMRTPALEPPSLARTLSRLSVSTARKTLFSALSPQESADRPIPPTPSAVWLTLASDAPASFRRRSPSRTSAACCPRCRSPFFMPCSTRKAAKSGPTAFRGCRTDGSGKRAGGGQSTSITATALAGSRGRGAVPLWCVWPQ